MPLRQLHNSRRASSNLTRDQKEGSVLLTTSDHSGGGLQSNQLCKIPEIYHDNSRDPLLQPSETWRRRWTQIHHAVM